MTNTQFTYILNLQAQYKKDTLKVDLNLSFLLFYYFFMTSMAMGLNLL